MLERQNWYDSNGWRADVAVFLLAVLSRVAILLAHPDRLLPSVMMTEIGRVARSITLRSTWADPYFAPTGPTAHHSPVYPLVLGLFWRLTPYAAPILNVVLFGAAALCIVRLGRACGLAREGQLGALLYCLLPLYGYPSTVWGYITLASMCLVWLCVETIRSSSAFRYGVVWGISSLCAADLLLAGAFLAVIPRRRRWRRVLVSSAVAAAVMSPWVIRNLLVLGTPALRSNFGLELNLSNTDDAEPLVKDCASLLARHPLLSPIESEKVREQGEARYNAAAMQTAKRWITAHPGRFVYLCVRRLQEYWLPTPSTAVDMLTWPLTLGAFAGLFLLRKRPEALVFAAAMFACALPHYVIYVSSHYRFAIYTIILIPLSHALLQLRERIDRRLRPSTALAFEAAMTAGGNPVCLKGNPSNISGNE